MARRPSPIGPPRSPPRPDAAPAPTGAPAPPGAGRAAARHHPEELPMTQAQLEAAVADATGESLRTVHRLGFGLLAGPGDGRGPEDLELVLDCPFCRRPVPYPGRCRDG